MKLILGEIWSYPIADPYYEEEGEGQVEGVAGDFPLLSAAALFPTAGHYHLEELG